MHQYGHPLVKRLDTPLLNASILSNQGAKRKSKPPRQMHKQLRSRKSLALLMSYELHTNFLLVFNRIDFQHYPKVASRIFQRACPNDGARLPPFVLSSGHYDI